VATNTDHLLPWVSGRWRLAESEIAWMRLDDAGNAAAPGPGVLRMRLSVACWRANAMPTADSGWRFWPGVELNFQLTAPPVLEPATPWGDLIGRISHGECHPTHGQEKPEIVSLGHGAQPTSWTLQLRHGETVSWQATTWQAWCDPGRVPQDWLHC
jgi:hypothetical protein